MYLLPTLISQNISWDNLFNVHNKYDIILVNIDHVLFKINLEQRYQFYYQRITTKQCNSIS